MSDDSREHLVVVGNGMAGMSCLDKILKRKPNFKVTVLSDEPYYNYNRIMLSSVLAGDKTVDDIYINTKEWYESNDVNLLLGTKAVEVDAKKKQLTTQDGLPISYDKLLLATGSDAFVPPMQGVKKEGVYVFRNVKDCDAIIKKAKASKKAVAREVDSLARSSSKTDSGSS